jgi:hypothetical protein|tara:strand:+ start:697 stop:900 length:204 start_codon:yes stop_codon:yes gene_type:complete
MKIQRLDRPELAVTPDDMTRAQFNRLADFIEDMPKQGSIRWNDLAYIGSALSSIAKDARKRQSDGGK